MAVFRSFHRVFYKFPTAFKYQKLQVSKQNCLHPFISFRLPEYQPIRMKARHEFPSSSFHIHFGTSPPYEIDARCGISTELLQLQRSNRTREPRQFHIVSNPHGSMPLQMLQSSCQAFFLGIG